MKKYIHYISILALLLIGATACESESTPVVLSEEYYFSLNTTDSRAATDGNTPQDEGVDDFNENKLEYVYLFFFNNSTLKYKTNKLTVDEENKVSFRVNKKNDLPLSESYSVYALANKELTTNELNGITSIDDLNSLSTPSISVEENGVQSLFVMSGQASITSLAKGNNGSITLYRSAAKISLVLDVVDQIVVGTGDDAITYVPETSSMEVTLHNGAMNGVVDGITTFTALTGTTREIGEKQTVDVEGTTTYVANHVPFYSYPTSWEDNPDNECYLELMIIWKNQTTNVFAPYYYRIPVNKDTKELLRNHHYKITTEVARLGSLKDTETAELTATFDIENWNEHSLYPNLKKYSYLWVEDDNIIMENSNKITINFASSSTANVTINSVKRDNPNGNKQAEDPNKNVSYNSNIIDVSIDNEKQIITVDVNRRTDSNDTSYKDNYRPWRITFTVTNADGISHTVNVEHRPAIYVIGNFNSNGNNNRFVYGVKTANSDVYGTATGNRIKLGNINDISNERENATNRNMNQYKIYISVLGDDESNYMIGDPRGVKNNLSQLTGPQNLGGLQNYHPTSSSAQNVIAPSFLIASSWGITTTLNWQGAERRCASYQENGYPAGRWRVPTEAEIKFIISLSNKGYIPALFQGKYYHSTGGTYKSDNVDNNASPYVRCVYDLWFWGDDAPLTGNAANTFTWGDQAY